MRSPSRALTILTSPSPVQRLDRVQDDVEKDLFHLVGIGQDLRKRRVEVERHGEALVRIRPLDPLDRFADEPVHVGGPLLGRHLAGVVQKIMDDPGAPLSVVGYFLERHAVRVVGGKAP